MLIHSDAWSARVMLECNYEESLENVESPQETYPASRGRNIDVDDYCHWLKLDAVLSKKGHSGDFPDDFCKVKKTRYLYFDEEQQTIELKENGIWTKYRTKDEPRSCDEPIKDDVSLCLDRWIYVNVDNDEIRYQNNSRYTPSFCPSRAETWKITSMEDEGLKDFYKKNCPNVINFGFDWMGDSLAFTIDRNTGEYDQNRKEGRVYYDKKRDQMRSISKVDSFGSLLSYTAEEVGSCRISKKQF